METKIFSVRGIGGGLFFVQYKRKTTTVNGTSNDGVETVVNEGDGSEINDT